MKRIRLLLLVLPLTMAACDRSSRPLPRPSSQPAAPAAAPATTQAWHDVRLGGFPLDIEAPQSWKAAESGPVLFLQGPLPDAEFPDQLVHVSVTRQSSASSRQLQSARAEREMHPYLAPGASVEKAESHDVGLSQIVSVRVKEPGQTADRPMMRWAITAYVHRAGSWTPYHLEFLDLTYSRYERNRDMLEKMISSLRISGESGKR